MNRTIVWFRRDLRLADHAPLERAARRGAVIPVFIFDSALLHHPETGSARVEFLLSCLAALDLDLQKRGGRLILKAGDPVEILPQLLRATQSEGIYAHTDCERIYGRVRDAQINRILAQEQMRIRWFEPLGSLSELIAYPDYRHWWMTQMAKDPLPAPARIRVPADLLSDPLPSLTDLGHDSDGKIVPAGGSEIAHRYLESFLKQKTERYYWQLSYPSAQATTGLSPYLKFGVISPRECVWATRRYRQDEDPRVQRSLNQFIARLRWGSGFTQRFRYLPQLELRSLYSVFDQEGWDFDPALYQAWQQGQTGFPIVDAAARCLLATGGWQDLNFRSRALYASFLSNLLGIDWRYGALHFMRHLIDGDCPIDHYQWAMQAGVTHCADKSWTRIYNPEQAAVDRCDPNGSFIKRWIPELAAVSPEQLGRPPLVAGYPDPILSYPEARHRRVKQLEHQRNQFRQQANVVPHLARLPPDLTPFGSEWIACDVRWASSQASVLFPPPLDLDSLSTTQANDLRSWLVAHVDIQPTSRRKHKAKSASSDPGQLSLLFNED